MHLDFLKNWIIILLSMWSVESSGFVVLSGPDEATLDVSEQQPTAIFYWNGNVPKLEDKEEVEVLNLAGLSDRDAMQAMLNFSLLKWSEVPGSYLDLAIELREGITSDLEDNLHAIVVSDLDSVTTAAFSTPRVEENLIEDCDITISSRSVSAKSLLTTLIHEVGHCIGLGHNHTSYLSIMSYARPVASANLSADDMAGVIYLYPDPNIVQGSEKAYGCAISASHQTGNIWAWILFVLIIPLMHGAKGLLFQGKK